MSKSIEEKRVGAFWRLLENALRWKYNFTWEKKGELRKLFHLVSPRRQEDIKSKIEAEYPNSDFSFIWR